MARIPKGLANLFDTSAKTQTEEMLAAGKQPGADPILARQPSDEIYAAATDETLPPVQGGRTPERNINLDYLDTEDGVNQIVDTVSRQSDNAGYKATTLDELRGELDIDDEELYSRLLGKKSRGRDYALTGPQLNRAREVVATSTTRLRDKIVDFNERLKTNQLDDIELLDLQREMLLHTGLQNAVQKETRAAARSLVMHKNVATPFNTLQMDAMMNAHGGRDVIAGKIKIIAEAIDPNASALDQLGQMNKAMGDVAEVKWYNQLVGYRNVQLLSSPVTHARNIIGNTLTALTAPLERLAAAGVSKVRGGDTEFGEAYHLLAGTLGSFSDGLRMARKMWQTGDSQFGSTKFDDARPEPVPTAVSKYTDSPVAKSWDYVYNKLMWPGKALLAEDEFFKTLAFNGEMRAASFRQARSEGLSGAALRTRIGELMSGPNQQKILDKVRDDFAVRGEDGDYTPEFQSKLANEEKTFYDLYAKSTQFAHYQTYTDALKTDFAKNLGKTLRNPIARLIVPFYRTPANILAYAMERSPAAPLTKQWRDDFAAGGARRDLAEARIAMGSITSIFIGTAVWTGTITGTGPSNPSMRDTYKADGWRPSSVKLGEKWVTYQGFDPFSTQMAIIANAVDMYRYATTDRQREHISMITIFAAAEAVKDRSFMQGIAEMMEAFERGKSGGAGSYLSRTLASFIPQSGLLRNTRKTFTDDIARSTLGNSLMESALNEIKSLIPFYSESLPPQVNVWGEERRYDEPYGPDFLSPFGYATTGDYGAATELSRNATPIPKVRSLFSAPEGDQVDAMKMHDERGTGWAYSELQKRVGEERKKVLDKVITTDAYKDLPKGPPDLEDTVFTQGDRLKQALQDGRKRGTDLFIKANKKQIIDMVQKGLVERSFWPSEPLVTTEKLKKAEEPAQAKF